MASSESVTPSAVMTEIPYKHPVLLLLGGYVSGSLIDHGCTISNLWSTPQMQARAAVANKTASATQQAMVDNMNDGLAGGRKIVREAHAAVVNKTASATQQALVDTFGRPVGSRDTLGQKPQGSSKAVCMECGCRSCKKGCSVCSKCM